MVPHEYMAELGTDAPPAPFGEKIVFFLYGKITALCEIFDFLFFCMVYRPRMSHITKWIRTGVSSQTKNFDLPQKTPIQIMMQLLQLTMVIKYGKGTVKQLIIHFGKICLSAYSSNSRILGDNNIISEELRSSIKNCVCQTWQCWSFVYNFSTWQLGLLRLVLILTRSGVATGGGGAPTPPGTTYEIHANPKTFLGVGG